MARDGFHDVLFPHAVALGAAGGPTRRTDIAATASGGEVRRARWAGSRRSWRIALGGLSQPESAELLTFFEAREGQRYAFAFRDPFDHSSNPSGGAPTPLDATLGTEDGTQTEFVFAKSYGSTSRVIDLVDPASLQVAVDGVALDPGAFSLDTDRRSITLVDPPAEGEEVTAGFLFDTPVRFASDSLELSLGARGAAVPSIELVEVRL
ncbi:DUF2460 domain-containing protein [Parvularcula sp. ZS-1/3]|uniref:DUF2460 domain-containing protein n=1 Tax=Parvularcula mediterranea TaxID=2732508 RepID=A0A7Y3RMT6_9PROT|nr:DUF2460 domain-containing protein [Parvularcula mediterranea]NNU16981.1 DUF2460 domain-containing protein [Parvularcula mediterranea]